MRRSWFRTVSSTPSPPARRPRPHDARQHGAKGRVNLRESFVLPGLIDCHVHDQRLDAVLRIAVPHLDPEVSSPLRASVYARQRSTLGFNHRP